MSSNSQTVQNNPQNYQLTISVLFAFPNPLPQEGFLVARTWLHCSGQFSPYSSAFSEQKLPHSWAICDQFLLTDIHNCIVLRSHSRHCFTKSFPLTRLILQRNSNIIITVQLHNDCHFYFHSYLFIIITAVRNTSIHKHQQKYIITSHHIIYHNCFF